MVRYKLLENGVKDVENRRYIPNSMDNRHWIEYLEWVDGGGVPEEEVTPAEQLIKDGLALTKIHEGKINTEIRRAAIETLKGTGELPIDYKEIGK